MYLYTIKFLRIALVQKLDIEKANYTAGFPYMIRLSRNTFIPHMWDFQRSRRESNRARIYILNRITVDIP